MAVAASTVFEIRTTGHQDNPGGFNGQRAGGVDRSQQDAPFLIIDGATVTATISATTTIVTLAGYTVTNADLGNTFRISGGGATGVYEITAVSTGSNTWTFDRAPGSAGGTITGRMGGASNSPQLVLPNVIGGNQVWIQAGIYPITTTTANTVNGVISVGAALTTYPVHFFGYQTTRGDDAARAVLQVQGFTTFNATVLSIAAEWYLKNIEIDATGTTGTSTGFAISASTWRNEAFNCIARGLNVGFNNCRATNSLAIDCPSTPFLGCATLYCIAYRSNFALVGNAFSGCFSWNCIAIGYSQGFNTAGVTQNCVAYRCATGFTYGTTYAYYERCIAHTCQRGFYVPGGSQSHGRVVNSAVYNCTNGYQNLAGTGANGTTGNIHSFIYDASNVTLTADPFTNAAAFDFTLNSDAAGGALVYNRANTIPTVGAGAAPTNYVDAGAVNRNNTGSSSGGGTGTAPASIFVSFIKPGGFF